jgi:diadenosine tetraphosphatase ApaH/serine/threonine PP2A family protein phosphatase
MRIAIVSDIHANLQAWNAVWLDLKSLKADRILCLGDMIGYGPHPAEVLEALHASADEMILGNHEAALCGFIDPVHFNPMAQASLEWTRAALAPAAVQWLRELPLSLAADSFRCAHGDFARPDQFDYVIDPADALPSWQSVPEPLLFVGHSHTPGLFLLGPSGTPHRIELQDFALEPGKRFLVNCGSVGHPRDGDVRASYCLFDTRQQAVYARRVPYDIDAFRRDTRASGLPVETLDFLNRDPRRAAAPLRQFLGFHPTAALSSKPLPVQREKSVQHLTRLIQLWQWIALLTLVLTLTLTGFAVFRYWRYQHRLLVLPAIESVATEVAPLTNLLAPPPAILPPRPIEPLAGWSLTLGNRFGQTLHTAQEADAPTWILNAPDSSDPMGLRSAPISAVPGAKYRLRGEWIPSLNYTGEWSVKIEVIPDHPPGAPSKIHLRKLLSPPVPGETREIRLTFTAPPGTQFITVSLEGHFAGTVRFRNLSLVQVP